MSRAPRVAVIGFGAIGRHHARILAAMPAITFVGVVDSRLEARAEAEANGYAAFADFSDLVLDAAVVAVPTSLHHEIALELIDRRVALLVEKPIAATLEQGVEMVERCERASLPLMIGYVERFNPAVLAAQRLLGDGLVGTPLHVATRRVGGMPIRVTDANVIIDIGVHDIDIISFLMSGPLRLVGAQGGKALIPDRIDYADLALDAHGIVANATMNWVTPVKVRDLIITGSSGYLHVDYLRQRAQFAPGRDFVMTQTYEAVLAQYEEGSLVEIPIERHEPLRLQMERFLAVVSGHAEASDPRISLISLQIALEATALIESTARAAVAVAG